MIQTGYSEPSQKTFNSLIYNIVFLFTVLIGYQPIVKGQQKDSTAVRVIQLPPQTVPQPSKLTKFVFNRSFIITEEDFKVYIRSSLGYLCRSLYEGANLDSIALYEDAKFQIRVPADQVPKFSIIDPGNEDMWHKKQNGARIENYITGYATANCIKIIPAKASAPFNNFGNDIFCVQYYSVLKDPVKPDWQYFVKGKDIVRAMGKSTLLDSLVGFLASKNSHKDTISINDSAIDTYAHKLIAGINLAWYKAAVSDRIVAKAVNGNGIYSIKEVKNRSVICETVSVQIDPNDPYSTKDSTYCDDYQPDKVYSGIMLSFDENGALSELGPVIVFKPDCDPIENYLFLLNVRDAMKVLDSNPKRLLSELIMLKIKQMSW